MEAYVLELDARGKRVLFISDTHIPYSHPDYILFLSALKKKLKIGPKDIVIHLGDELDFHKISFHNAEEELFSAGHELDKSIIELQEGLHKLFPKLYICESNHGSLMLRKMKHHGLPIRTLRPLPELYETPRWSWHDDILLRTKSGYVYVTHGKTKAYGKMPKEMGVSCVQGHFHANFEITYHKSVLKDVFNMLIGCLVDQESLAQRYAKNNIPKCILGTGSIDKAGTPSLHRMKLGENKRWTKKL